MRLPISTALMAASKPLLPLLAPARSMACSSVSQVSTPNATGMPNSMAVCASPLDASDGDVVEVRRVAADHGAQADDGVVPLRGGQLPRHHRQLPGAGRLDDLDVASLQPVRASASSAPASSRSVIRLLKRVTRIANFRPFASRFPSITLFAINTPLETKGPMG